MGVAGQVWSHQQKSTDSVPSFPLVRTYTKRQHVHNRNKAESVASTRAKFIQPDGDQLTMLSVMRGYLEVDKRKRGEWASDNFINIRLVS